MLLPYYHTTTMPLCHYAPTMLPPHAMTHHMPCPYNHATMLPCPHHATMP
jgi:hypothetical protein